MKKISVIFYGLVIGAWSFFSTGTLCVSILAAILLYLFGRSIKDLQQRRLIINICILAVALRFIFCIFNYYFSWGMGIGADLIPDARAYSASGQYIAEVITGNPMLSEDGNEPHWLNLLRKQYKGSIPFDYRVDAFARYVGGVYAIFGYSPITVKFINSFLSLFTAILLFLLARDIFSIQAAKITLFLGLFWPSIFLWSVSGNKDSIMFFLITLLIFIFIRLRKYIGLFGLLLMLALLLSRNHNANLLIFIIILFYNIIFNFIKRARPSYCLISLALVLILKVAAECILSIRHYFFVPLEITFLFSVITFLAKKRLKFLVSIIFILALISAFYISKNKIDFRGYFGPFIEQAFGCHRSQLYVANSAYRIYPDRYYADKYADCDDIKDITPAEFILSYLKGLAYTLFAPFIWSIKNKIQFFVSFQMIIYYLLAPFIFSGILLSLRLKWRDCLPIIIFLFVTSSIYALYEGNVGTLFRHRDILINFQFIFMGAGIGKLLGYI